MRIWLETACMLKKILLLFLPSDLGYFICMCVFHEISIYLKKYVWTEIIEMKIFYLIEEKLSPFLNKNSVSYIQNIFSDTLCELCSIKLKWTIPKIILFYQIPNVIFRFYKQFGSIQSMQEF